MAFGKRIALLVTLLSLALSCSRDGDFDPLYLPSEGSGAVETGQSRQPSEVNGRVMIMVSAGYNSLRSYLSEDLQELSGSYLPPVGSYAGNDVLLVFSRLSEDPPVLYRMFKGTDGETRRDTLKVWPAGSRMTDPAVFRSALELARDRFPSKSYGMVFSSHASGWLPARYYTDPAVYEREHAAKSPALRSWEPPVQWEFPAIDPYPAVKSLGQDKDGEMEMELKDFVDAIPMHLDYLLLDACLAGCVEVAYALKDKADLIGFSQTEVLANGFDYTTLTQYLLGSETDPVGVCKAYFDYYDRQTGSNRSATISVLDLRRIDTLAQVCARLFDTHRDKLRTLSSVGVQGYFRFDRHFFYDLKDILVHAGITPEEEAELDQALNTCIVYKAATEHFLSIDINTYSGLSMYLPSRGTALLNSFYKENMAWNAATGLVE